eukprot:Filipodium_phascolosomae@DN7945_c0_g1_i1.p1
MEERMDANFDLKNGGGEIDAMKLGMHQAHLSDAERSPAIEWNLTMEEKYSEFCWSHGEFLLLKYLENMIETSDSETLETMQEKWEQIGRIQLTTADSNKKSKKSIEKPPPADAWNSSRGSKLDVEDDDVIVDSEDVDKPA